MLLFYGCATSSRVIMFGNTTYPEREANATIDVYVTASPTKEYMELAKITCTNSGQEGMQQLQKEARKIGADAVIITGSQRSQTTVNSTMYGTAYGSVTKECGITAIAIKYK